MTGFKIQLQGGRSPDVRVELATLDVAEELRIATPERIRREVSQRLGRQVSWNTVAKYLHKAARDGKLEQRTLSKRQRKMVVFFCVE